MLRWLRVGCPGLGLSGHLRSTRARLRRREIASNQGRNRVKRSPYNRGRTAKLGNRNHWLLVARLLRIRLTSATIVGPRTDSMEHLTRHITRVSVSSKPVLSRTK